MPRLTSMTILDFGRADIDLGSVMAPGDLDGQWAVCAFPGFLFELDDGRRILADTGPNRRHIVEPMYEYGDSDFVNHLKPQMRSEDDPRNRLAELGLSVDDVDILVLTHTHFDHAGNTADFAGSEIVVHRDAHAFGRERWEQGIPGGIPELGHNGTPLSYRLIDGDEQLAEGLTLYETPGHAPGHMSLLAELPASGAFLLAIDAIYSRTNHERDNYQVAFDTDQARASAHRCIELARAHNARLIYGHDPDQWNELRKAPSVYR